MLTPVQTASAGMIAASDRFDAAAIQLANVGAGTTALADAAQVDLSSAAMEMLEAKTGFSISISALSSTFRAERQVVDLLV